MLCRHKGELGVMIDVSYVRVMTRDIILVTSLSSCHDITLSLCDKHSGIRIHKNHHYLYKNPHYESDHLLSSANNLFVHA